eukprot:COSAG02_NODE_101_length_36804_cov_125.342951_32_plen_148_part_00
MPSSPTVCFCTRMLCVADLVSSGARLCRDSQWERETHAERRASHRIECHTPWDRQDLQRHVHRHVPAPVADNLEQSEFQCRADQFCPRERKRKQSCYPTNAATGLDITVPRSMGTSAPGASAGDALVDQQSPQRPVISTAWRRVAVD